MTPGEMADILEPDLPIAAAMLRKAERLIRAQAVLLTHEGLGVDGTNEWLGMPDLGPYAADHIAWLEGGTA